MIRTQSCLIKEALVREIREAQRWSAVVEAWEALLKVRRMSKSLLKEQEHLTGKSENKEFEIVEPDKN